MKKKTKTQEKLINVHKLNYDDVKGDLKANFNKFMANPKSHGVKDEKLIKTLQGMPVWLKHSTWKKFKEAVHLTMKKQALDKAASAFITDFEDEDHQLHTIKQLEKILDDPKNPKFGLEEDMIAYIQNPDFKRKDFIKHVAALDADLDVDKDAYKGFGHKIHNFLKDLTKTLSPIVNKIENNLVDLAATTLKKVLDKHVPESLKEVVEDTIDVTKETIKEIVEEGNDIVNDLITGGNDKQEEKEDKVEISGNNEVVEEVN